MMIVISEGITNFALSETIGTKPIKLALAILQEGVALFEFVGTNFASSAPVEVIVRPETKKKQDNHHIFPSKSHPVFKRATNIAVHLPNVRNNQVYTPNASNTSETTKVYKGDYQRNSGMEFLLFL